MPKKSLEDSVRVNKLDIDSNGVSVHESDNDIDCDEDMIEDNNKKDDSNRSQTMDSLSGLSSNSSPERMSPFESRYKIVLGNNVTKNGSVVMYSIESIRCEDDKKFTVLRQYEDFEYLHHCLTTAHKIDGLIVPPLPLRPAIEPELAHKKSKKQLGADSKTVIGDEFNKDCWLLQNYLRLMTKHPVFGSNNAIDSFLTEREPLPRPKLKKGVGFITKITDSFDNWKYTHKDCDEFFQKERDFVNEYSLHLKEASDALNDIISGRQKLCEVLSHLSAALNLSLGHNEGMSRVGMKFCNLFSKGLDDYRHCLEVISHNDTTTLGNTLYFWHRYHESHKEMLFKRTCLMIDYENANKTLDKAKNSKKKEAEEAKILAEKDFEDCSEVARQEIKRFHRDRIEAIALNMRKYAESQLIVAKDMVCVLRNSVENLKKFQVQ
jgi:sorting nexin-5/6/32